MLQLGSCIKDPECPVCFKLNGNGSIIEVPNQAQSDGGDKKSLETGGVTGERRKELIQRGNNVGGKR